MALMNFISNPTNRQLRQFGVVGLVVLPSVTWLWTLDLVAVCWAGAAGLGACGIGFVAPTILKPVYLGLTIATMPIGLILGEVVMLLIYFGLFLPMSIVFRIIGRDALKRRTQNGEESFWQKKKRPTSVRNYYHQF